MKYFVVAVLTLGFLVACGDTSDDVPACDPCVELASCDVTTGVRYCICPAGYVGDGTTAGSGCATAEVNAPSVDECAANTDTCVDAIASCTDTAGAFDCTCASGYVGDGRSTGSGCTNVNECAANTDTCAAGAALCTDTPGSFTCACPSGYVGDGQTAGTGCTNIDECTEATDNCVDVLATCLDTDGSFTCTCAGGYAGDGTTTGTGCVDVDECALATATCDAYATCTNTTGAFTCGGFYATSPFQPTLFRLQNLPVSPATTPSWVALSTTKLTPSAGGAIQGCNALANDPTNGDIYAIVKQQGVTGRPLGKLDPTTGVVTIVGNLGDNFSSIAFRDDGQLFGVTGNGAVVPETLYLVDKSDATKVLATALGNGSDGEVIQFNPDDGKLYHWSGGGTFVFESVETTSPYAVTNVPVSGVTGGETFGAYWDAGTTSFIIFDIGSRVRRITASGTVSAMEGGSFPDDLRSPANGPALPHLIEPAVGAVAGGETVVLRGAGFSNIVGAPTVSFGGVAATSVTVVDDAHISVVTPAGTVSGPVDVQAAASPYVYNWPAAFAYE